MVDKRAGLPARSMNPGECADMFRRLLPAILALMGAAAVSACAPQTVYVPTPVGVPQVPVGPGCDTRFQVVNNSSRPIYSLQYSHASRNDWGPDQLGQSMIPVGGVWNAQAANAGLYDFRITWNGGGAAELRRVDICRASRIVVYNNGIRAQ